MTTQIQANESQIKEPPRKGATSGTSVFLLIWFGQVIALIGSGLTGFALGVWVYQQTGSAIQLSIIVIFTRLPGIVVSPLAGALVDRLDRRLVLILCDLWAGLSVLSMETAKKPGHTIKLENQ